MNKVLKIVFSTFVVLLTLLMFAIVVSWIFFAYIKPDETTAQLMSTWILINTGALLACIGLRIVTIQK